MPLSLSSIHEDGAARRFKCFFGPRAMIGVLREKRRRRRACWRQLGWLGDGARKWCLGQALDRLT